MNMQHYNNSGWFDSDQQAEEYASLQAEAEADEKQQAEAQEASWKQEQERIKAELKVK